MPYTTFTLHSTNINGKTLLLMFNRLSKGQDRVDFVKNVERNISE